MRQIRRDHPRLKAIVVADGLARTGPFIRALQALRFRFLLGGSRGTTRSATRRGTV